MKEIRLSELFPGVDFGSRDFTPEELAVVYQAFRATFTAEDLQRYTELDEGYSAEDFLRELEQTQQQFDMRTE